LALAGEVVEMTVGVSVRGGWRARHATSHDEVGWCKGRIGTRVAWGSDT
jgi:hypothetical protein